MILREAQLEDTSDVVAAGQRFIRASSYSQALEDRPEEFARFVAWLIDDDQGAVWVLEQDGAIKGILGAVAHPHPMDGLLTASEMFWWVDPDVRGHGLKLLRAFEAWATRLEARKMVLSAPTPDVERLFERLHYTRTEASYQRNVPWH